MEESDDRDFQGNFVRQTSLRQNGSLKSGKSTPRGSPSFRKLHFSRTPRREVRSCGVYLRWIASNPLLLWLFLIALWAYLGFHVQSRWAHGDDEEKMIGYGSKSIGIYNMEQDHQSENASTGNKGEVKNVSQLKRLDLSLAKNGNHLPSRRRKSKGSTGGRRLRGKRRGRQKGVVEGRTSSFEEWEVEIPKKNTSYGLFVGPFGSTEDRILGWNPEKRRSTCDRKGEFVHRVWSRKFVLIFHELSMTGAPLSMMELATELMSCGATVSSVVLSKKGGLMAELAKRKIKVLEDKAELSYKTAMKADLIIAGSAVCASWIEQYLTQFPAGSNQIVWWIMENRWEYFDRSKLMLNQVKMLMFLSESQSKQWVAWCEDEGIKLKSQPALVPLSVNDELAFVAGIPCSLNTPSFSVEKMMEKRQLLRDTVRKGMGLTDNDMLVMSLSSINTGKGQLLLLESARSVVGLDLSLVESGSNDLIKIGQGHSSLPIEKPSRAMFQNKHQISESSNGLYSSDKSTLTLNEAEQKGLRLRILHMPTNYTNTLSSDNDGKMRKILSDKEGTKKQKLKVLIGSVGSKSNKVPYVKSMLKFLSQHSNLSKSVLWTPATTRVASLYAAADVYIINSQGLGETFGRVTIEAMAFGLPVLGTDAGGTKEIVDHNITGLLHPIGHQGSKVLAQNIQLLLENPTVREQMAIKGRRKVESMYLKHHMYKKLADVLQKCMRIK
ncbi:uncharacterized protein LOC122070520 isoform X1 [Macadamia integrifolia]|uniref:uncharacterized protein LOC122070520 isoform X1 n=1 Tax=Macadamia integrifolia TaxID=60698 RepID=UPI001C4E343C|nr:uncharacterized protein LOC122070520 isoform X1 [Macadamia integrifolia]XP_042490623.1 uncharacterized protein LOC122070520 isoform X1 [Macadamia integrifolia]